MTGVAVEAPENPARLQFQIKGTAMKLLLAAVVLTFTATAGHAAGACGGDQMVTMRVSKLTAAGTPAGFLDAVKDHKA